MAVSKIRTNFSIEFEIFSFSSNRLICFTNFFRFLSCFFCRRNKWNCSHALFVRYQNYAIKDMEVGRSGKINKNVFRLKKSKISSTTCFSIFISLKYNPVKAQFFVCPTLRDVHQLKESRLFESSY